MCDHRARIANAALQALQRARPRCFQVDAFAGLSGLGTASRVCQQALDKLVHAQGRICDNTQVLTRLLIERFAVIACEQLAKERDGAQGFLQVVTGGISELLQIFVRTLQP